MSYTESASKTVVQKHESRNFNGKTYHTFVGSDGKKYGTKLKSPPPVGAYIQFDFYLNAKGYAEVENWAILPNETKVATSTAKAAVGQAKVVSKDDYWLNRDLRDVAYQERQQATQKVIELQSCRNTAVEFIKVLLEREFVPVPKTKADQEEYIVTLLNRYTQLFLEENSKVNNKNDNQASPSESETDEPPTPDSDPSNGQGWM